MTNRQPLVDNASRRDSVLMAALALIIGVITMAMQHQPGYTDAYYYLNAATRFTHGQGLTDAALWTYIGAPATLPAPAFLYWMPLASLVEGAGIAIGSWLLGSFHAAQLGALACYVLLAVIGYRLGRQFGQTRRTGWIAGLLTIFSGFFLPYWTNTDTFAVYGLIGALALVAMGKGRATSPPNPLSTGVERGSQRGDSVTNLQQTKPQIVADAEKVSENRASPLST